MTDFIDRLPGPYWLWYLGGAVLLFLAETFIQWSVGHAAFGAFSPWYAITMGAPFYTLVLMHYLDRKAGIAFDHFLPALDTAKADPERLRYRLTTMPAVPVLVASAVGALIAMTALLVAHETVAKLADVEFSGVSFYFNAVVYLATWIILGALFFHTVHQLRGVRLILDRFTRIHLLKPYPLHALSGFTLHSAVGLGVLFLARFAEPLEARATVFGLLFSAFFALVMTVIFLLPLLGIHRLLAEAKEQALSSCGDRIEALLTQVRKAFEEDRPEAAQTLGGMLNLLESERNLLAKIPTWPWQPETFRGFIAAVLLPLIVWLVQNLLERLLAS